jgi:hypothetical protein
MRMPRVRFSVRGLMVAVAFVAVPLWTWPLVREGTFRFGAFTSILPAGGSVATRYDTMMVVAATKDGTPRNGVRHPIPGGTPCRVVEDRAFDEDGCQGYRLILVRILEGPCADRLAVVERSMIRRRH